MGTEVSPCGACWGRSLIYLQSRPPLNFSQGVVLVSMGHQEAQLGPCPAGSTWGAQGHAFVRSFVRPGNAAGVTVRTTLRAN
eukprot:4044506-Alexandrium_andersonii.AAC.1